jgi:uncharacterized delta-60 repeat protein
MIRRSAFVAMLAVVLLACALVPPATAGAVPGDLDPTFGAGGIALTSFGEGLDKATGMAIQPDGKYVLVGTHQSFGGASARTELTLTRFNPDGSLDQSFGVGGRVLSGLASSPSAGDDVEVDPSSGAILVCRGGSLVRFLPGGALDASFGANGVLDLSASPWSFAGTPRLVVRSDGTMLLGLSVQTVRGMDVAVFCLRPDGSIDTTFGTDGHVIVDVAGGSNDQLLCLALAADGGILVGGQVQMMDGLLIKLTSTGSLDPQFGRGGIVLAQHNWYLDMRAVRQMAAGPNGTILTADGDGGMGLKYLNRYFADGSPDTGWGACPNDALPPGTVALKGVSGFFSTAGGLAKDMNVASNGSVILAGTKNRGYPTYNDVWLARVNANGTLDTGFGSDGQVITDLGGADDAVAAGIDSRGRLLLAAYAVPTGATGGRDGFVRRAGAVFGQGCVRYQCGNSTRPSKPALSKLSSISGKRGAIVTISGKNFGTRRGASYVKFGSEKCAAYLSWNATRVKCRVPPKARPGRLRITMVTSGGASRGLPFSVKR